MGKALITNKIYLEGLNSKQFEEIARTLTYKIPKQYNPNASRFSNSIQFLSIKSIWMIVSAISKSGSPWDYEYSSMK